MKLLLRPPGVLLSRWLFLKNGYTYEGNSKAKGMMLMVFATGKFIKRKKTQISANISQKKNFLEMWKTKSIPRSSLGFKDANHNYW